MVASNIFFFFLGMAGGEEGRNGKSQIENLFSIVTVSLVWGGWWGFFVDCSAFLCPQSLSACAL